jgi:hypothetical protein
MSVFRATTTIHFPCIFIMTSVSIARRGGKVSPEALTWPPTSVTERATAMSGRRNRADVSCKLN